MYLLWFNAQLLTSCSNLFSKSLQKRKFCYFIIVHSYRRMATKADDHVETTLSTVDSKTASINLADENIVLSSGDEIRSTDDDALAQPAPLRTSGRGSGRAAHNSIGTYRFKAGKVAKEAAAGKLLKTEKLPATKFIIVVNNMTNYNLARSTSSGSDSWPFSSIKKQECVAALYDHSHFKDLNVVFTADDDQPGIRTVMLYAHWTDRGRGIGIYAGKTQANSEKINRQKIHDHELHGNKAAIDNPGSYYLYGYDINELEYAQFGVAAGDKAVTEAIEGFTNFCIGSMPGFTFVVNNLTGYDLTLSEKYEMHGIWPLDNIKKGECAVAGFDQLHMSLAARYSAGGVGQQQKFISLAGSWPVMGYRKIYAGEGMKAKDAWKKLSRDHQNWPMQEGGDNRLNSAYIEEKQGNLGEKSCVYVYVLRKL